METYPHICQKNNYFEIGFVPNWENFIPVTLKMVLDFDIAGNVVGIEVINLVFQVKKDCFQFICNFVKSFDKETKFSYDKDSDCFYLKLKSQNSTEQKSIKGEAFIDDIGRIVGLNAKW